MLFAAPVCDPYKIRIGNIAQVWSERIIRSAPESASEALVLRVLE